MIYNIRTSYRDCQPEELGTRAGNLREYIERVGPADYVPLFTCNRAEVYSTNPLGGTDVNGFISGAGVPAIEHLFRVACGLDSMTLGETEILAQVKRAHEGALESGHCSERLSGIFDSAIKLGRKARSRTQISHGKTSLASIAVDDVLSEKYAEKYDTSKILVIGSGMIAGKLAAALKNKKIETIFISNRHYDKAQELAVRVGGQAFDLEKLPELLDAVQVVFCATSAPHAIINQGMIPKNRRILFVDLGVPYNVFLEAENSVDIEVLRLDYFMEQIRESYKRKESEIKIVEKMIDDEIKRL
ncbi:MAG: hypothetical protein WAX07_06270 [Candidatus Altiarchaeia archaeon]